jgi:hypothetical protein
MCHVKPDISSLGKGSIFGSSSMTSFITKISSLAGRVCLQFKTKFMAVVARIPLKRKFSTGQCKTVWEADWIIGKNRFFISLLPFDKAGQCLAAL